MTKLLIKEYTCFQRRRGKLPKITKAKIKTHKHKYANNDANFCATCDSLSPYVKKKKQDPNPKTNMKSVTNLTWLSTILKCLTANLLWSRSCNGIAWIETGNIGSLWYLFQVNEVNYEWTRDLLFTYKSLRKNTTKHTVSAGEKIHEKLLKTMWALRLTKDSNIPGVKQLNRRYLLCLYRHPYPTIVSLHLGLHLNRPLRKYIRLEISLFSLYLLCDLYICLYLILPIFLAVPAFYQ